MGNLSSCLKTEKLPKSKNMAKLVDSQGKLRLVNLPTTVAELMLLLGTPCLALTSLDELRRTRRIVAMSDDACLIGRNVYLLIPIDKVNSRLSDLQVAALDKLVIYLYYDEMMGRTHGCFKASLDLGSTTGLAGRSLEDFMKNLGGESTNGAIGPRIKFRKTWQPVLEPILEEECYD